MGFVSGFVNGFARAVRQSRVELLCAELGWPIDQRNGNQIRLAFHDAAMGSRPVYITDNGEGVIQFRVFSFAFLPPSKVPEEIFAYLLLQNASLPFGKWHVGEEDGELFFALEYYALSDGVIAHVVKTLCRQMVDEAGSFDERMKKAGVL